MNEPDNAPSPKRFWSRLGMRNAALNASAATERWPKKYEKIVVRANPAMRLAKMPIATIASAPPKRWWDPGCLSATRRRLRPRDRLIRVRGLPREPRHDDRVLLQILRIDALVHVRVGVVRADVVVLVFLHLVEAGNAGRAEAEVIGRADAGDHVAPHAEIL